MSCLGDPTVQSEFKERNIIVLLSGGMDSCGALIAAKCYGANNVQPVFINRGQQNYANEKAAITRILADYLTKKFSGIQPTYLWRDSWVLLL